MSSLRSWGKLVPVLVFLLGVVFCIGVVRKFGDGVVASAARLEYYEWILLLLWMVVQLVLSVSAWRKYLAAFSASEVSWITAYRQLGLLLIGKYVPGGVFGFLARLHAGQPQTRGRQFAAGLAEQMVGAGMSLALGVICFVAAKLQHISWLLLAPLLPFIAVLVVRVISRMGASFVKLRLLTEFHSGTLVHAATFSMLQHAVWAFLVGWVAWRLFEFPVDALLGVAGTFGIAVAAGIVMLIAPGGIGVREGVMVGLCHPWLGVANALLLASIMRLLSVGLDLSAGAIALGSFLKPVGKRA